MKEASCLLKVHPPSLRQWTECQGQYSGEGLDPSPPGCPGTQGHEFCRLLPKGAQRPVHPTRKSAAAALSQPIWPDPG